VSGLTQQSWAAEEGRSRTNNECKEVKLGLHGGRDLVGYLA
jgi:hypothetical protein